MNQDDLNGVVGLTIEYCEKVSLPVNKLGFVQWIVLNNTNDIELIHSEQNFHDDIKSFNIINSTLQKFSYKASNSSKIDYLTLDGVKVTEEIVFSNIKIHTLNITNCEINKVRQEAFDVKVTNGLNLQNNAFKEVESNAFKKLR